MFFAILSFCTTIMYRPVQGLLWMTKHIPWSFGSGILFEKSFKFLSLLLLKVSQPCQSTTNQAQRFSLWMKSIHMTLYGSICHSSPIVGIPHNLTNKSTFNFHTAIGNLRMVYIHNSLNCAGNQGCSWGGWCLPDPPRTSNCCSLITTLPRVTSFTKCSSEYDKTGFLS